MIATKRQKGNHFSNLVLAILGGLDELQGISVLREHQRFDFEATWTVLFQRALAPV